MVRKSNLKPIINLIHLIILLIYFKKEKLGFRCNFELYNSTWLQAAKDPKTLRSYYLKDLCFL